MSPVTKDHARHMAIDPQIAAIQQAAWTCPACEAVNAGPMGDGCQTCSAGAPARRAGPEAPPPPFFTRVAPTPQQAAEPAQIAMEAAARWLGQGPRGGVLEAYLAGYAQAGRDLRDGMLRQSDPNPLHGILAGLPDGLVDVSRGPGEYMGIPRTPTPGVEQPPEGKPTRTIIAPLAPEGKPTRTILAALALFRDQVLVEGPEEIATGEWCSAEEVTALIVSLQQPVEVAWGKPATPPMFPDDIPF